VAAADRAGTESELVQLPSPTVFPPLPPGEGRGEGECQVASKQITQFQGVPRRDALDCYMSERNMSDLSPLQQALAAADLSAALKPLEDYSISTKADVRSLVTALKSLRSEHFTGKSQSAVTHLVSFLQKVESQEAFDLLLHDGIAPLHAIFHDPRADDELKMFLLKIFAMYHTKTGARLIVESARVPLQPDNFLWSVIFRCLRPDHPATMAVCLGLSDPLPEGFIGIAYLDLANLLATMKIIPRHPFDTPKGIERLRTFLIDSNPSQFSFAHSAAGALAVLEAKNREALLAIATGHPDTKVQMRAAWAQATLGNESGIQFLSRQCLDPRHSQSAWSYLEDLQRQDMIPIEAQRLDFRAMAEMCNWLSHPQEFGRPPDEIEQLDTRELNWPPTNDRRRLWLFKFSYKSIAPEKPTAAGVGLVGSITYFLKDETSPEMSPEDIYGLHCCWELETKKDGRAPKQRTAAAGRGMIGI
jgi:hypothetical protein